MTASPHPVHERHLMHAWHTVRFGDVVRNVDEAVRDPQTCELERFVGLEHIDPESLRIKRWGQIAEGTSFTRKFTAGQLLFGKRRAYQRKVAVADFDGLCSSDILVFEPADDQLLPELLPFIVQTEGFFQHALGTSAGSLSPRTRWRDLAAYEFPLPPLNEQRRIAEILWAAEDLLDATSTVRTAFDLAREAILRQLLTNNAADSIPDATQLPLGWRLDHLGNLCDLHSGNGFTPRDWSREGLPIIRIQNLNGSPDFNRFSGDPEPGWIIEPGDLLFAWAGTKGISFGPSLWPGPRGVLNQHIYRVLPKDGIDKTWLYETLKLVTRSIEKRAHGFKLELVHVRQSDITSQLVRVPPAEQQVRIADESRRLSELEKRTELHFCTLRHLKTELLKAMLRFEG
jgi:type I restriction enzyme, S subunit